MIRFSPRFARDFAAGSREKHGVGRHRKRRHARHHLPLELLERRILLSAMTVATSAASAISATGATLNGSVDPAGTTATAYFQYSTDSTFTPTIQTTVGSGFSAPYGVAVDAVGDVFVADVWRRDRGKSARVRLSAAARSAGGQTGS